MNKPSVEALEWARKVAEAFFRTQRKAERKFKIGIISQLELEMMIAEAYAKGFMYGIESAQEAEYERSQKAALKGTT